MMIEARETIERFINPEEDEPEAAPVDGGAPEGDARSGDASEEGE
jgi:hypothetical protein